MNKKLLVIFQECGDGILVKLNSLYRNQFIKRSNRGIFSALCAIDI